MYSAKVLEVVPTKPGCWEYTKVGIFQDDVQIGSYIRNYNRMGPFYPFQRDGKWYALYSKDYTATRVMSLPDCKDIGGEERDGNGFCPVHYYVPSLEDMEAQIRESWGDISTTDAEDLACLEEELQNDLKEVKPFIGTFGFVAGCVWGDDTSWKIEFVNMEDLTKLKVEAKFGYIQLPDDMELKDVIDLKCLNSWGYNVGVVSQTYHQIKPPENTQTKPVEKTKKGWLRCLLEGF
jgi:hypothetical protein